MVRALGQELVFGRVDRLESAVLVRLRAAGAHRDDLRLHVDDDAQHVAALSYAGAALGAVFAGDFLSLFLFWELMALSAALIVWLRRERGAVAAGFRYLLVHLFGGVCLLGGIALHWSQTGSITFGDMSPLTGSPAFALILVAFLLNAAVPPLGAWLPDAYSKPLHGSRVPDRVHDQVRDLRLDPRLCRHRHPRVVGGRHGGVRRGVRGARKRCPAAARLLHHQPGRLHGVRRGNRYRAGLERVAAHAFAHILYKALLFMGAGAVLQVTGLRKLNEMGGLYKTMPLTLGLYMVGAFAISAVPLFSGFVSKAMVVSAAGESHLAGAFLLLTVASSGTFLHTGLKLPYYMFFGRDRGLRAREPPSNMLVAMGLAAAACIGIGVFPGLLYGYLPYPVDYAPYTARHVTATLGLLGFTALGFFLLLRHLIPNRSSALTPTGFTAAPLSVSLAVTQRGLGRLEHIVARISDAVMHEPVLAVATPLREFDAQVIDAAAVGVGRLTQAVSQRLSLGVSGHAQHYALVMAIGVLVAIAFVLFGS